MKKIVIKKGLFKKPSYRISKSFLDKCVPASTSDPNAKVAYVVEEDNAITLYARLDKEDESTINIGFKVDKSSVFYKEATGFFKFRDDIFYRSKGAAGRSIVTDESFSSFVQDKYPDEFKDAKASVFSTLEVYPLHVK